MTEIEQKENVETNEKDALKMSLLPQTLSKFEELSGGELIIYDDKEDKYLFPRFDELSKELNKWINKADGLKYTPEDRANIKSILSFSNKVSKSFDDSIKQRKKHLFNDVDKQRKEVVDLFSILYKAMSAGLEEADKKTKAEKREKMIKSFESAKKSYPKLNETDLIYEDFELSHWINLSTVESKAIKELNNNMNECEQLLSNIANPLPENDSKSLVIALRKNAWKGLNTLNYLIEEENERKRLLEEKEKELIELKRLEEERLKEKLKESNSNESNKVEINHTIHIDTSTKEEFDVLIDFLKENKYDYKIV